jgi:glyoxylase-like metal-dependent hydrolase (beta-lactamase superfamily II)
MTTRPADSAIATDAAVHRIRVPTPFGMGPTNAYLILDDPITLIDTGPNWATALDGLEGGLAGIGVKLADIGLVVLTHHHVDHIGLAGLIARRHGADVACLDAVAPYLRHYPAAIADEFDAREGTLSANGVEAGAAAAWRSSSRLVETFGDAVEPVITVADGDLLALRDRTLRFLARPGHSTSDTILVDESTGLVFGGDHLLAKITSNALVDRALPPAEDQARSRALLTYRDSLRLTRELDIATMLPGHGRVIDDHRELIDRRLTEQEERAREMAAKVEAQGRSARDVAAATFGEETLISQTFLVVSEVLGHLDLAVEQGWVDTRDEDGVAIYEAVAGR